MSHHSILLALFCSSFLNGVLGSNTCQPATWNAKRAIATYHPEGSAPKINYAKLTASDSGDAAPGQIVCRYYGYSDAVVNYYTCTALAAFYDIPLSTFFSLNPNVTADCANIQPSTQYCIRGYVQPLISTDGNCGPNYNNASCKFTDFPCCNSATWKCGNSTDDCAAGTCWEGFCQGHDIYAVDGKCGYQNNGLLCAGKWGDCCNAAGQCGTGADFCGDGKCQSGNCTTPLGGSPAPFQNNTNATPDGTCGPAKGYMCNVAWGNCCNSNNTCGSLTTDCAVDKGCQNNYGLCGNQTWSSTTTSRSSTPVFSFVSSTTTTTTPTIIRISRTTTTTTTTAAVLPTRNTPSQASTTASSSTLTTTTTSTPTVITIRRTPTTTTTASTTI